MSARAKKLSLAPGPHRWSPFGSLPELRRDPLATLINGQAEVGDVIKFRAGPWFSFVVCHPDDVKHVLQDNNQNYHKGFSYQYLKPVLGMGLLTNEGESWLSQRRLAQPAFHRQRLAALAGVMTGTTGEMLDRWHASLRPGEPVDVAAEMTRLALDVVGRTLLGSDLGATAERVSDAVKVGQEHVNWRITHLFSLPEAFPTPRNIRFRASIRVLDGVVYGLINERRREQTRGSTAAPGTGAAGDDLLTLLLEARDEATGEGMSDRQVRDEVMTIFLAGHETTANALAWTWHLLAQNPEVEASLHDEVDSVLGGRIPSLSDLPRLEYTRMVLDESLRLYPPAWAVGRFPLEDDVAGGYRIPRHSQVILSPYVTHRHRDFWEEPQRFDPERFRPGRINQRPRYAYFPFGGGPRMCIGYEFALMEAHLALAAIAQEFRLRPVANHTITPEALITLRPLGGLPMLVEPREGRALHVSSGDGLALAGGD